MTNNNGLNNLLSTVTYKEKEESIYGTEYYKVLTEYFEYDIYENTGMKIDEVFNMDTDVYNDMITLLVLKLEQKNKIINELKDKQNNKIENYNEYDLNRLNKLQV